VKTAKKKALTSKRAVSRASNTYKRALSPGRATKKPAPAVGAARRSAPAQKRAPKKASASGRRADFGAPTAAFFAKQAAPLRPILEALRSLIEEAAPAATSSIKWGMPFYELEGTMMCALGAHKGHVNLILAGDPSLFRDPDGRLSGDGKTGRHLKLTSLEDLPRAQVKSWIRTAAGKAKTAIRK
jgi:hypothetical protein